MQNAVVCSVIGGAQTTDQILLFGVNSTQPIVYIDPLYSLLQSNFPNFSGSLPQQLLTTRR